MLKGSKDYYRILEVSKEASPDEIKKSFHRLAFLLHPDRNGEAPSEEQFKEINEAYQCLSNPKKRQNYDVANAWITFYPIQPEAYLKAEISMTKVKLNQEFEITYRYIGEGRFLKKPSEKGFIFTSGPVVSHRNFLIDDVTVRETALTYTVCAKETGTLIFDPATIEVRHQHILSNKFSIEVTANKCYFKLGFDAGNQPLLVRLQKEQLITNSVYRKTYTYRHGILIPRSDYAAYYHRIGSIIKVVFAVCGLLLFPLKGQNALLGLIVGSLVGGITCRLMYWMSGVRSKYFYAYKYPIVANYVEQGYQMGNNSINIFY